MWAVHPRNRRANWSGSHLLRQFAGRQLSLHMYKATGVTFDNKRVTYARIRQITWVPYAPRISGVTSAPVKSKVRWGLLRTWTEEQAYQGWSGIRRRCCCFIYFDHLLGTRRRSEVVAPGPPFLRETTKENEGCRATPLHHSKGTSRHQVTICSMLIYSSSVGFAAIAIQTRFNV